MSYNTEMQSNNAELQEVLDVVNNLPDAGSGTGTPGVGIASIQQTTKSTEDDGVAASLFAKVLIPDVNVIPEWEQPNSTNPHMIGDKVTYKDKTWISNVDNNVWEPGVYGWSEI